MPQSFGRFQNNFTLRNLVCNDCNHYFGNNLELFLGRESYEGQLRFRHGLKGAEEFKGVGRDTRIVVRSTEGMSSDCYMLRYYNAQKNDISVRPLPQVGFMLAPEQAYRYFLLDEIPEASPVIQYRGRRTQPDDFQGRRPVILKYLTAQQHCRRELPPPAPHPGLV